MGVNLQFLTKLLVAECIKKWVVSISKLFIYVQYMYYEKFEHITYWYFANFELLVELFEQQKIKV
jgi:citrate lyase synthetase